MSVLIPYRNGTGVLGRSGLLLISALALCFADPGRGLARAAEDSDENQSESGKLYKLVQIWNNGLRETLKIDTYEKVAQERDRRGRLDTQELENGNTLSLGWGYDIEDVEPGDNPSPDPTPTPTPKKKPPTIFEIASGTYRDWAAKRPGSVPGRTPQRGSPSPQSAPGKETPYQAPPEFKNQFPPSSQADFNPRLVMPEPRQMTAPKGVLMRLLIGRGTLRRAEAPRALLDDIRAGK